MNNLGCEYTFEHEFFSITPFWMFSFVTSWSSIYEFCMVECIMENFAVLWKYNGFTMIFYVRSLYEHLLPGIVFFQSNVAIHSVNTY